MEKTTTGFPVCGWLKGYSSAWLRLDLVAGLTTAAVVIPKCMAYAVIAGLPVQAGLYVALAPMLVYALTGTSRTLSVSTTTTLAILTATQLALAVPRADPAPRVTNKECSTDAIHIPVSGYQARTGLRSRGGRSRGKRISYLEAACLNAKRLPLCSWRWPACFPAAK